MELLEIRTQHDMTAHVPETRRATAHSYLLSCRQFMSVLANFRKPNVDPRQVSARGSTLGFMTLGADQIWMTEEEIASVVSAIHSAQSPVSLA